MKITTMITPLISPMTKDWAVRSWSGGAHKWGIAGSRCSCSHQIYDRSVNETANDYDMSESESENGKYLGDPLTPLDYIL